MTETDERVIVNPPYIYRATIVSVYDGDTITVDLDLGFGVWMHKQKIRLFGINTPEVRGKEREVGLVSRDALRAMLPQGSGIVLKTKRDKKGKYGRWLGEIYYETQDGSLACANEVLVARGLAKRVVY